MKMTMHIDEAVLARVMKWTGARSKTEAVAIALREMDRKAKLAEFGKRGLEVSPADLKASVDPDYDVLSLRMCEKPRQYRSKRKR